jgi:predicted DNA-binding protein with PD1-like motif
MSPLRSEKTRHLVLRLDAGEQLPGALLDRLREEGVTAGWLRAGGVLADVELRAYDPRIGGLAPARSLAGPLQALTLEGAVGTSGGGPSCALRAVLAREADAGLEVLGGEVESARVVALEALVTVLDDVSIPRAAPLATQGGWSGAVAASTEPDRDVVRNSPAVSAPATQAPTAAGSAPRIPQRPVRQTLDLDSPVPEAGDVVEHFAFGRSDVIKSDGDRLHLRVHKDGRVREIALEMLRVTRLDDGEDSAGAGTGRRFKLDRKM